MTDDEQTALERQLGADGSDQPMDVDIAVLGGGSAAEALVRALDGSGCSIVVFEPELMGGVCPFLACIPSKSMLHSAASDVGWTQAMERRREVTNRLDDTGHARQARQHGATIIRERAVLVDDHHVAAGSHRVRAEHIVIATGAGPVTPELEGIGSLGDALWTSDDAMRSQQLPGRLGVIGGGAIGCEMATAFAGLGSDVVLFDESARPFPELSTRVGEIVTDQLAAAGIDARYGSGIRRLAMSGQQVIITTEHGDETVDRLLIATGRQPNTRHIGLENLGIEQDDRLTLDGGGRVVDIPSLWVIGDAAGLAQHTHVANHHAAVVAARMMGDDNRTFDEVVVPSCVFLERPVMVVGPTRHELEARSDIVWAEVEVDAVARSATDELGDGVLVAAASRETNCLVAAHGVGPRFDELVHAFTIAIDGKVRVDRLQHSLWAFPTVGSLLGPLFDDLAERLLEG